MTTSVVPALIDPPYWGSLQDWIDYREDLRRSGIPGIEVFVKEADEVIAHRRNTDGTTK